MNKITITCCAVDIADAAAIFVDCDVVVAVVVDVVVAK